MLLRLLKRLLTVLVLIAVLLFGIALAQLNPIDVEFDLGFMVLPALPLGLLADMALFVGFTCGVLVVSASVLVLRLRVRSLKRALARAQQSNRSASGHLLEHSASIKG